MLILRIIKQIPNIPKDFICGGGAAKGSMLSNLLKNTMIVGCIDSNPYKQGKFIHGVGYQVLSPKEISFEFVKAVLVENDVYFQEIYDMVQKIDSRISVFFIDDIFNAKNE